MVQTWDNLEYDIILLLLGGGRHVRDIGKALNASHSTVSRRLNRLVGENVLDYQMEGKNKVFFIRKNLEGRNHVYNAERYKLGRLLREYPTCAVAVEDILAKTDEKLIVLFGSYAKFLAKKDSDIDVYVETNNRETREAVEGADSRVRVKTGEFNMESPLIREIVRNHVILRGTEEFYEKTGFFKGH